MTSVATYIADGAPAPIDSWSWKNRALPAIHMPRGVSRISLLLEEVRVERLQDITEDDANAEGVREWERGAMSPASGRGPFDAVDIYERLWGELHGPQSWRLNSWVWVLRFQVLEPQHVGHPIIFSAPMVRALLAGTKTQTRRLYKDPPSNGARPVGWGSVERGAGAFKPCPFGRPGDQLWVREGVRRTS